MTEERARRRRAIGIAAAIGTVATVGTVVAIFATRRKPQPQTFGRAMADVSHPRQVAPPVRERVRSGGMTLKRYEQSVLTIGQRAALLQDFVANGVKDAEMRRLALAITNGCPPRDGLCEAQRIYGWMRQNVRYTGDIAPHARYGGGPTEAVDLFQHPKRTVEFRGGDCDDHSILAATLATLNGIQARFRITGPSRDPRLDDWGHVYVVIGLPKERPTRWIAIDSTLGRTGKENLFGIEAPYGKRMDFDA